MPSERTYMLKTKIKIHQNLLQKVSADKKLLKLLSTFLCLKALFPSSVILNLAATRKTLAEKCFIGKRTFDARITELQKLNVISIKDDVLTLISYEELYNLLELDLTRERYYRKRIKLNPEYIIRSIICKDHLFRQEQRINRKIEKKNKGSAFDLEKIKSVEYERFISALENRLKYECYFNPDITLSQTEIATLFGLLSQGSGFYWTKKLSSLKLMQSEQRVYQVNRKSMRKKIRHILGGIMWHPEGMEKDLVRIRNKVKF